MFVSIHVSTWPNSARVCSTIRATSAGSVTSARMATARTPSLEISSATLFALASEAA
jgi:hypothetical protein